MRFTNELATAVDSPNKKPCELVILFPHHVSNPILPF